MLSSTKSLVSNKEFLDTRGLFEAITSDSYILFSTHTRERLGYTDDLLSLTTHQFTERLSIYHASPMQPDMLKASLSVTLVVLALSDHARKTRTDSRRNNLHRIC